MVWISLQESAECHLPLVNGLGQSHIAKLTPIVKEYSCQEYPMDHYTNPLMEYGMTLEHLKQICFYPRSTSSTVASHARESALQVLEKAWRMSEAAYFSRSSAYPKKSSPHSYSLRMSQQSQQEADFESLEKLPKWGMIVDFVLYPLQALERYTVARDGSYWLTPTAMDHLPVREGEALENALHRGKNRKSRRKVSGRLNEQVAYPQMWPTPTARDWKDSGMEKSAQERKSPNLPAAVRMWPTPDTETRGARINQNGHHLTLQDAVGSGKLNPQFVEWLMGYPIGWTELSPWAIQWLVCKRKKRSKS